jgi:orotate phosphoribosyltransferase
MDNKALDLLKKTGAILVKDHFVGTSGLHFDTYINKDALYPHTEETSEMGRLFAEANRSLDIDVVAAPAIGGIILSTWTAHHLTLLQNKEVLGVYTEKNVDKDQVFTRGYDTYVKNKNVLIVEDLTTTGGSVKKVVETVQHAGGNVVQVCVMVNKDPNKVNSEMMGVPFSSLAELKVTTYTAEKCPLCKDGVPINTSVGHGKKFLDSKIS